MDNEMITVKEIASFLRVSLPTAYSLVRSGSIPHVKVKGRYIIPKHDFLLWVSFNSFGGVTHG